MAHDIASVQQFPEPGVANFGGGITLVYVLENLHIQRDWATMLAFLLGLAVIVPSLVALVFSLAALLGSLL